MISGYDANKKPDRASIPYPEAGDADSVGEYQNGSLVAEHGHAVGLVHKA